MRLLPLALLLAACADGAPPAPGPEVAEAVAPEAAAVVSADDLMAVLPAEVGGVARGAVEAAADSALGASVVEVEARYGDVRLVVADYGTAEMIGRMGLAGPPRPGAPRAVVAGRFVVEAAGGDGAAREAAVAAVDAAALAALADG